MAVRIERKPSLIRQFIVDTQLNGDAELATYRKVFDVDKDVSDTTVAQRIKTMKKAPMYNRLQETIVNGFYEDLGAAAQRSANNYLKRYDDMLNKTDKLIDNADNVTDKLKAIQMQRENLKSNPFSMIKNLNDAQRQSSSDNLLDDGSEPTEAVIID